MAQASFAELEHDLKKRRTRRKLFLEKMDKLVPWERIGGRGPLWLVFDPPGSRPATDEEESMWPWSLFFIGCG